MPKMKSNSSVKKRFKLTASGKITYHPANASHIMTKKSAKRKRHLSQASVLNPTDARRIKNLMTD